MTQQITQTDEVLASMLTEDTGRHLLDSGGAYGRNWERMQAAVGEQTPAEYLLSRPESEFTAWIGNYDLYVAGDKRFAPGPEGVTLDLFHWLRERVDYNQEEDEAFQTWAERGENEHRGWLELMEEWPEVWAQQVAVRKAIDAEMGASEWEAFYEPPTGIYGDGQPMTVNTYNHESVLSQIIQYTYYEDPDGGYRDNGRILLQVHGGCDVRGGYTRPRIFNCSIDEYSILDDGRVSIGCDNYDCSAYWDSDNGGYSFDGNWNGADYADHNVPSLAGSYNSEPEVQYVLRDDPFEVARVELERKEYESALRNFEFATPEPPLPVAWVDRIDQYHGTITCPCCETGTLSAWAF